MDLEVFLIFPLGKLSRHDNTRGPLFSCTLEEETVDSAGKGTTPALSAVEQFLHLLSGSFTTISRAHRLSLYPAPPPPHAIAHQFSDSPIESYCSI